MTHLKKQQFRPLFLAAAGACLVLSACSDGPNPLESPLEGSQQLAYDYEIDRSDSHLYSDVTTYSETTVSSEEPFPHPHTGASVTSLTVTSPVEQASVEAGYDVYGTTRTNTYFPPDPELLNEPGEQIARILTVGDAVYQYDGLGNYVQDDAGPHAINQLGSLVNATIDGSVRDGDPGDDTQLQPMYSVSGTGSAAPAAPRVERLANGRVRVTRDLTAPAPGQGRPRLNVAGQGQARARVAQTYRKQGAVWILEEVRAEMEQGEGGRATHHVQVVRYRNVKYKKNKERDEARRAARAAKAPAAPSRVMYEDECSVTALDCGGGGDGGGTGGGSGGTTPAGGTLTGGGWYYTNCDNEMRSHSRPPPSGSGPAINLVVQHGFMDAACSYSGGRTGAALYNNLYSEKILYPTLPWAARYEDQAADLMSQLSARTVPANKYVMVGYSNGGIVSRLVGQSRPDLVRGVVSVSTPHRGLPIMKVGRGAAKIILENSGAGLAASCSIRRHAGCNASDKLRDQLGKASPFGVDELVPVSGQMVPNTAFHAALNSATENFRRVGIEQHTRQRWVWARVAADLNCDGPELDCGGRKLVRKVDDAHKGLVAGTILSGIVGIFWTPSAYVAGALFYATAALNAIDVAYDLLTSPFDGSDGVVPNASQRYPNSEHDEVIQNADSHDAAKKSDKAIRRVGTTLVNRFGAQTPPGSAW